MTTVEHEIPMGMYGWVGNIADSQHIIWHHLSWRETNVHLNVRLYKRETQFGLNSATLPVDIRLALTNVPHLYLAHPMCNSICILSYP